MMGIHKVVKSEKFIGKDFNRVKKDINWLKTLKIFYIVLGFEDNVDDHEPGRPTTREKFEKND